MSTPLVQLRHVTKHYPVRGGGLFRRSAGEVHAVDDISLEVRRGETMGLVGETGCGKSTLARCITRLIDLTSGQVIFDGRDISRASRRELRPVRRRLQMVFQDPYGSLNPRRRVGSILGDPFAIRHVARGEERKRRVQELMRTVGLNPEHFNRFPAEFSGGQRQRIGLARALALSPDLIVCDEPVSALDVSIQAQVLNLLADLQTRLGLTYVFIAHDLAVVRYISTRIAVMYLGKIVELSGASDLYAHPRHPYTAALLSAEPVADPDFARTRAPVVLSGDPPSPVNPPPACRFHPRCPRAQPICATIEPPLASDEDGHAYACHFPVRDGEPVSIPVHDRAARVSTGSSAA